MKRRNFLTLSIKAAMAAGYTSAIPASLLYSHNTNAAILAAGLSNPARQPLFSEFAPNALDNAFKYRPKDDRISIFAAQSVQETGLIRPGTGARLGTTIWGYGTRPDSVTWPGMSFERNVDDDPLEIEWINALVDPDSKKPLAHLLPVDSSLHWAYGSEEYPPNTLKRKGVPLVPHVHGGKNDSSSDGNPEYFFSPGNEVVGPRYVGNKYTYGGKHWNDVAGMVWYHDHALGLTRLNVYAGLAGFFALRDENDSGKAKNEAGLPAGPYELGFAVQDRMFRKNGQLFYPAFPGDPAYEDFIDGEGAILPEDIFPGGGPTALAEFFGDHIVVNGKIWPRYNVEQRQYRVRLLNGCDSRFMRLRFRVVDAGETNPRRGPILPFYIVGADQSLRRRAARTRVVDFMPGERLDLVLDFKDVAFGKRVIIENLLGDSPFGGELPDADDLFPKRRTDRIMAFDVVLNADKSVLDTAINNNCDMVGPRDTRIRAGYDLDGDIGVPGPVVKTRKLALFEGTDEFGRLQPLLGTAVPVLDVNGDEVTGSMPWHLPITENPEQGTTEIWEIYNATGDAHPIHVHLVYFKVLEREGFSAELVPQITVQHNGEEGEGFRLENIVLDGVVAKPSASERARRDMVMALPDQVTRIKLHFDKPGRYVWHCHILSHEDHEMMRPFHVGPVPSSSA